MPIASLFAVILTIALTAGPVRAHDWYPRDCCSGQDCAPAIEARALHNGLLVRTVHGTVLIPSSYEYRESRDGRLHACMQIENGETKLICAFRPPMM